MTTGKQKSVKKLVITGVFRAGIVLLVMGMGLYFQAKKGVDSQFYSILAGTIIGAAVAGFSVIYDYDVWSTRKKIAVHTLCMAVTVIPAYIIGGWFDLSSPKGWVILVAAFVLSGVVFAGIGYLISKYILKNVPEKQ